MIERYVFHFKERYVIKLRLESKTQHPTDRKLCVSFQGNDML